MRKLQTQDVFKFARVIRDAELKEIMKDIALKKGEKTQDELGYELLLTVIEACGGKKVEDGLYEFFGGVFETEAGKVKTMFLDELMENLKELAKENNLENFIKLVSRLN